MIVEKSVYMSPDKKIKVRYAITITGGGEADVKTNISLRDPSTPIADIRTALDAVERDISNKIAGLNMLPSEKENE